ncbi:3'(2'),5'-bisphosphate nucleotidase CysQ [Micromonospora sp. NPDC048935]|uniref:3'(2'),5'-bisphosphate nucleotidase CysQ n=1 Tax=Micromonospora sp. NPDC048935 TaxID=3364262 RepID=UPI00371689A8
MNVLEPPRSEAPASDGAFAAWLAERAGRLLLRVRAEHGHADPAALKRAGDRASHQLLRDELARCRSADAVLSEEDDGARQAWATDAAGPPPERLAANRVWIIDPLDGTREFSEPSRTDWAVHVALWQRNAATEHRLVAGAIALPAQLRTLGTEIPPPRPTAVGGRTIRLAVSRSRPPAFLTELADQVGAELVPMGSAGAKIAAVISGEVDAYVHAGGQYEWDSAAPVAVATATGMHASRIDGTALSYNEADPRLPDLVVCQPDLATPLLAALRQHLTRTPATATAAG